ncbi:MAG TPA: hypothetical protein VMK66_10700 [Myxococcales bacterium]|nr:hypothetical protein [Myxococcales bacterium]
MADLLHPRETDAEEPEETPDDRGEFVVAVAAENQVQAQLFLSICEGEEIPAILQSPRSGPVGTISSPVDGFNILVPRRDAARAIALLEDRKRALESDPDAAARAAEEEEAETER